jgi:O-antigen ligase
MPNKKGDDILLSFAAFFQIVIFMLQELLISTNIVTHEYLRNISIFFAAIPMIPAAYIFIKRQFMLFLVSYLILLSLIILTIILFPDNKNYLITGIFYLLCMDIPCFLCLASIRDYVILRRIMLNLSYMVFILGLVYFFLLWVGRISFIHYSMTFSYYLLLPALVFVSQRKLLFTIFFIITCILMLMLGSRGALIWALLYTLLLIVFDSKSKNKTLLVITIICVLVIFGNLLSFLLKLSENINITSRTLNLIIEGNFTQDSERFSIYNKVWSYFLKSPIWGYGIFGDRVILGSDTYSHNIFLEILYDFGLFFGLTIILLIIFGMIRAFLISNYENRILLIMLIFYCFIPFLVSGSYLIEPKFWILMGLIFSLTTNTSYNLDQKPINKFY